MSNEVVIPAEQAMKEVLSWLDYKKVSAEKTSRLSNALISLATAIVEGYLFIDSETKVITQKLKFPIGSYTELKYKPRVTMLEVQTQTAQVKQSDVTDVTFAYLAAITGISAQVLKGMDSEDYSISEKISFFFMD